MAVEYTKQIIEQEILSKLKVDVRTDHFDNKITVFLFWDKKLISKKEDILIKSGDLLTTKLKYMYEFEKHSKLTDFVQEMASSGKAPQEWTSFIETLNQALRIHDVVGRSEQLCEWEKSENKCTDCGKKIY